MAEIIGQDPRHECSKSGKQTSKFVFDQLHLFEAIAWHSIFVCYSSAYIYICIFAAISGCSVVVGLAEFR